MLTFGMDTCTMAATSAVTDGDRLLAQVVINCGKTHSQKMMPQVEAMLRLAEIDISDIDLFAAAVGPGSFTGVRIGVATVKSMAQALKKPCVAVSTLEALAYSSRSFDGILCPMIDARREQVYNALFEGKKRLTKDNAIAVEALAQMILEMDKKVLFIGDGAEVYYDIFKEKLGEKAYFAQNTVMQSLGGAVAFLGYEKFLNGETVPYADLNPSYVRLSQAEQELAKRLK